MAKYNHTVRVSYSQYLLHGQDAELTDPPYAGGNGLIWVDPAGGSAVVFTGMETGDLPLAVQVLDQAPEPSMDDWDDVVEVSVTFPEGGFVIYAPADMEGGHDIDLGSAAGPCRVRVHARGRDRAAEAVFVDADAGDELVEEHRILIWPAAVASETRWKLTDGVGTEIRARS